MSTARNMTNGIDAALPLQEDNVDLFYKLHKNLKDNIKQNLKMLLYTAPGERIMVPEYGVGLRNFLFEQSPEDDIKEAIFEQVAIYVPQVEILSLEVSRAEDREIAKVGQSNTLTINLVYEINGFNVRDSIIAVDSSPN
tara:strand:- start:67 stop:483 length:417 start_codon:yes stop_codon:yes gene_type:complete